MGRIIRFPIKIKTDFATEANYGVTPALYSTVRPISAAAVDQLPSEKAMRDALSGLTVSLNADNPASGEAIFAGSSMVSGVIDAQFYTLSGRQSIVAYNDQYYVNVGTNQPGVPSSDPVNVTEKTVNGGILQRTLTIAAGSFSTDLTSIEIMTLATGMCLGKILIRCTVPWNVGIEDTTLSIGVDSDEEYYVKSFSAPQYVGAVSVEYGDQMYDKVEYVSSEDVYSVPLYNGKKLKIYLSGPLCTVGEIQLVLFYDQI